MSSRKIDEFHKETAVLRDVRQAQLGLLVVLGLCMSCAKGSGPAVSDKPLPEGQVVMTGVVFDRFESDQLIQRVRAEQMRLHRDEHKAAGTTVQATLFGEDLQAVPRAKVFAPRATVDLKTEITHLVGGVQVVDGSGRKMEAASVTYDAVTDRLYTSDPVRMTGANFVLTGQGLELSSGQDELRIGGPVELVFDGDSSAPRGRH